MFSKATTFLCFELSKLVVELIYTVQFELYERIECDSSKQKLSLNCTLDVAALSRYKYSSIEKVF